MGTPIENNTTELQAILEAAEMLPSEAVLYAEQTLTDAQKSQARENIGAVSQEELENSAYTHPTYTAKSSGLYKVTVDDMGHVSGTTAVQKSDITALGIPAQDTTYTLPAAGTSLGGVKSGGDVTISNGTITVNDDSHAHVIANVDGLQSALDAAGTITGVSVNGTSVATSGVANIPAASTSAYGVTKLSSSTNDTSTTTAATPSAVKAAYDLANSTVPVTRGGTGYTTIADATYTTARYRASSLHSTETTPTTNGVIAWMYE